LSWNSAQARQFSLNTGLMNDLKGIVGEYRGEIRLQSSDGSINRLVVSDARVELSISEDALVLKPLSDLVGKNCQSKVGGIRELFKSAKDQVQVLRAEFDFSSKSCLTDSKFDALLVLLERGNEGDLTLETLLVQRSQGRDTFYPLNRGNSIHGYLTKIDSKDGRIMSKVTSDVSPPN